MSERPVIDYAEVKVEDLEVIRESKKSHFQVRHIPTGTIGEKPVLPITLDRAKWHSIATLDERYRHKGVTAWVGGTDKENHTVYLVSVRGGNEYLQALAADIEALKWTFDPPPSRQRGRPPRKAPVTRSRSFPLGEDFVVDDKDEETMFKELDTLGA